MARHDYLTSRLRRHTCKRPVPLSVLRQHLARLMIERYGVEAAIQAAKHGNALRAKGDVEGLTAWLKVIVTIERLQATKPSDGETVQ